MEPRNFIFCFALLATAASFSIPDHFPKYGNGSLQEVAYSRCRCSNGKCFKDNRGNVKCVCKPGYALQDEFTCKPCDCGEKGKCLFTLSPKSRGDFTYEKKCVCDVGSAEKDGKCIDCFCGENSACEFNGEEKNCYCIEGYSEKDGQCTRCDCGFYGKCEFNRGRKQCTCDEGFLELGGTCEECNCGDHGKCTFVDGVKYCHCEAGYQNNGGVCEECNCGEYSAECQFSGGEKICKCQGGFADRNGMCEECFCGFNSVGCSFYENQKVCSCKFGYVQKGNTCEEGCGIYRSCKNGGECINGYCRCLSGTRGEFCDVIDGCEHVCPKQQSIACAYDTVRQTPYCACLDHNLRFNPETKQCQRPCDENEVCRNGGVCTLAENNNFCRCRSGTEGDFCENVPECNHKNCGKEADCRYDVNSGRAVCQCQDWRLSYDTHDGRCKRPCGENEVCRNGGICSRTEYNNFCRCRDGTEGDFCENVPECNHRNCGKDADCKYDVNIGRAVCQCQDWRLSYDVQDGKCKRTCDLNEVCRNDGICARTAYGNFCHCRDGTEGDFCENVPECNHKNCGKDADCKYNVNTGRAICQCQDWRLSYDEQDGKCKRQCDRKEVCRNGGICTPFEYNNFCRCRGGTEGDFCEIVPECSQKKCGKDADCTYDVNTGRAICQCKDWRLSYDVQDEKCKKPCDETSLCINGGNCTRTGSVSFCRCREGTEGDLCDQVPECWHMKCTAETECRYDVREERAVCQCKDPRLSFDPREGRCKSTCDDTMQCRNGAKCRGDGLSKFCECLEGTEGDFCEKVIGCKDCGDDAYCAYSVEKQSAVCLCRNSSLNFDERGSKCKRACGLDSDCNNGGKCDGGFCDCLVGTLGDFCETVPECDDKHCGPDARCIYSVDRLSAVCTCVDTRYTFDEADGICKRGCVANVDCTNGGSCRKKEYHAFCDCLPGTGGDLCEVVDDCKKGRTRCKGDAFCVFDQEKLKGICACPDERKRYDASEEECKVTCTEDATCHNGGLCMHRGDYLFCECKVGTSGNLCETVVECQRGLCGNSSKVDCIYDLTKEAAECKCKNPQHIFDPVSKTCKACDCGKNSISCRLEDGKKVCVCQDGYEARNGKCQKVKCTEKRCQNGKCHVVDEEEVCSCYEGYELEGDYCRKLNCSKTPCYNGTCIVRHGNREECVCQDGYTLRDGYCIRGACRIDTCFGGHCDIIDGELMCVCPKNYSLQGIGCFATVCKKQHCFGGWCVVNEDKEEICTCHDGYVLVNDVCKRVLCEKPCFGGQCKFVDGKEECICPPGFSIFEDVCRENKGPK